jgi:large subunit ribosomal protein L9
LDGFDRTLPARGAQITRRSERLGTVKELGMKVILNKDLATLGEEGDVKDVAKGYARNYLFPRNIALPYNERTIKLFEARKEEIEARKARKRQDAAGLKEKLEALTMLLVMPAGANGKLYGAVTAQTVADELAKQGFQIERKRIEVPGNTIKSVGKYRVMVKLYESAAAECTLTVEGQPVKTETKTPAPQRGRRRDAPPGEAAQTAAPSDGAPSDGALSGDANDAPVNNAPANNAPVNNAPVNNAVANDAVANDTPADNAAATDNALAAQSEAAAEPPVPAESAVPGAPPENGGGPESGRPDAPEGTAAE